jgi:hypothetical protein
MSALYATINDCAAKNKPTGRGHRTIAATVKDWNYSLTVALAVPPKHTEMDTFADITIKDLRTGEEFLIDFDELATLFKQAKIKSKKREAAAKREDCRDEYVLAAMRHELD